MIFINAFQYTFVSSYWFVQDIFFSTNASYFSRVFLSDQTRERNDRYRYINWATADDMNKKYIYFFVFNRQICQSIYMSIWRIDGSYCFEKKKMATFSVSGSTGKQVTISLHGLSHEVCVAVTQTSYLQHVNEENDWPSNKKFPCS